mmetsp:Transcript_44844/g.111420  ORF Transcript_44844/g.111420 Transcript_44844/m.111420 type:complete len:219 (-) Transcript_44844:93-749(-)
MQIYDDNIQQPVRSVGDSAPLSLCLPPRLEPQSVAVDGPYDCHRRQTSRSRQSNRVLATVLFVELDLLHFEPNVLQQVQIQTVLAVPPKPHLIDIVIFGRLPQQSAGDADVLKETQRHSEPLGCRPDKPACEYLAFERPKGHQPEAAVEVHGPVAREDGSVAHPQEVVKGYHETNIGDDPVDVSRLYCGDEAVHMRLAEVPRLHRNQVIQRHQKEHRA